VAEAPELQGPLAKVRVVAGRVAPPALSKPERVRPAPVRVKPVPLMVPVRGMEAVQDPEEKVRVAVRGNWPLVLGVEDCEKVRAAEPEAAAGEVNVPVKFPVRGGISRATAEPPATTWHRSPPPQRVPVVMV
jgi:hypothetical protein